MKGRKIFILALVCLITITCLSCKKEEEVRIPYMKKRTVLSASVEVNEVKGPVSGSIYREYIWKGPFGNYSNWQAITDPNATHQSALKSNPVNKIKIDDLNDVIKAEVSIEQWSGHAGTSDKKIKINDSPWYKIPEPDIGNNNPESYQYFRNVTIPVPVEHLKEGENKFQFSCAHQIKHNFGWGQWGIYGVVFRMYYSGQKQHSEGKIVIDDSDSVIGDNVDIEVVSSKSGNSIKSVDFFGYYEDFDHDGDGVYNEWHYSCRYGELKHHIGTVSKSPFRVTWDTTWIPDQKEPVKIMAKITDKSGICYNTPVTQELTLVHPHTYVKIYKPYDIPERWQTRIGKNHGCKLDIEDNLEKALDARIEIATWSGGHSEEIGLNGKKLVEKTGAVHDYSFDTINVPLEMITEGTNSFYTLSSTEHHGIEVMWPGPVMKIRYRKNETDNKAGQ